MKGVDTIARVRREFHQRKRSIKQIARELHISRNTVRKILRSDATAFSYERERQPLPKIGPWKGELDRMLFANEGKAARERLTLIRIYEELQGLGFAGGYDAVRRYARSWDRERGAMTAEAFVPLVFAPGEAYQFDWSHEVVLINNVTVTVKIAHVRLCHSRMFFLRAYPRETQEMVFDAHDRAFAFFRGTCQRGIYDNMKTAVDTVFVGKDRGYNRRFLQMCSHYLIDPTACTPAAGWEKGQVENQVGLVRERFFTPRLRVKSYAELNDMMNKKSGVQGLTDISSDMRDIDRAYDEGDPRAILARDMHYGRIKKFVGQYAAEMGGVDLIVFTGGVGENSEEMRESVCSGLEFMGVKMDAEANNTRGHEAVVSAADSKVKVLLIPTDEELMIAMDTAEIVGK